MDEGKVFTRDFVFDTFLTFFCSLNYFALLINIVGFSSSEFGASSAEAGMAAGIYVIGGLLARVLIGKYIELVGRKRMLIIGVAFALAMSVVYFAVTSLTMLYIVRLLHGMSYGVVSSCTSDIVSKLLPEGRRGEGLGYYYLSITAASAIGPLLGMTLGTIGNYDLVFSVGVITYSLALVCALLLHVPEETLTEEQVRQAKSFRPENLFQFSAVPLALTVMVFYFGYSGVLSFISSYAQEIDMVEAATYFYLAVSAGTLVSRFTTGRIYDRRGPNIVMIPGYLAFIVGMVVFSQTSSAALFLCSGFVIGYGISIIFSVCQAIVVSKSPPHRYGVTSSTFSALNDLGTGLGPSVLGLLIPLAGYREMYLICAGIGAISLIMYWMIHGRRATRPSESGSRY